MREGWEIKTLGELAVKITDGSHNPPKGIEQSEYLMLSSQNVWNGYLDKSIARHLSKQDFLVEDKRTCAREGDVLLTIVGTIGRTCVLTREDTNITFQRSVCVIKPKPELNSFFLSYQLQFKNKEINEQANGAAQKGFYLKQVERLPIAIPSLPEQQRIVDILDREFAKIDALKANAEKSLQAAKDLFQATLKKELEPKEGWKKITLKDIAIVRVGPFGSSLHKNDYISGGTPLVNPIHMKDGQVVPAVDFSVNQEKLNELRSYVLKEGDIVFARRGEIGRCALITDKEDGYLCGTGSLFVRFLRKTNSKFMIALFNSPFVKEQLLSKATGATMLNINSTSVENLELDMPTDKEQESILSCIDDLNKRCNTLQENYQKTLTLCDDLKQSLLRKAFNGEL